MQLGMTQSALSAVVIWQNTMYGCRICTKTSLVHAFNDRPASAANQALLLAVLTSFAVVSCRTEAELSQLEHRQANSERHANKQGFGMSNVNQRNKHTNFMNAYKNVSSAPDNQKVNNQLLYSTLYSTSDILVWQMHTAALGLSIFQVCK